MDTSKPLLSGLAATILGTVGTLAAAVSPVVPAPWGALVGIVGFLLAALAGLAVAAPKVTEGRPILQGVALAAAAMVLSALERFYDVIPVGWPQSVALASAALLAVLTGKALPALGSRLPPAALPKAVEPVADLEEARRILGGR
jgi:NaMN:DMB phosphoribosyltransferase